MTTSPEISRISAALLRAQKAIGGAAKGAKNPFFHSNYADLGSVMAACKEQLNDNGISILQPIEDGCVSTMLLDVSGEWIKDSGVPIVFVKQNDPQAQGAAITYARRYGLMSMLFIPAVDDDGEGATNHADQPSMYLLTTAIDKCQELYDKQKTTDQGHDAMPAVIQGLKDAKAGKKAMTAEAVTAIKERAIEKLALL